ncbi:MAG: hypothetical protein LUH58_00200 [Lachnospiraceae bacterium]|nr:hypothetical protein [Lachnospiraceae bacterium]
MRIKIDYKETFRGEKRTVIFLLLLLIAELVFILYSNLFMYDTRLDMDMAKLYLHVIEMWENKAIFISGWSYGTTLEFDCASILALPLYGLTGNIYLAFAISNLIFCLLLIWVLFQIFEGESTLYPLASAVIVFIPYQSGLLDYYNMMFFNGSQYIVKALIPLLLTALLKRAYHRIGNPERNEVIMAVFI